MKPDRVKSVAVAAVVVTAVVVAVAAADTVVAARREPDCRYGRKPAQTHWEATQYDKLLNTKSQTDAQRLSGFFA